VCEWFNVVVFTASLEEYANPLIDILDPDGLISRRMFRDVRCVVIFAKKKKIVS
jgi:TFIIF-interacting CTD phosphatase-like protein